MRTHGKITIELQVPSNYPEDNSTMDALSEVFERVEDQIRVEVPKIILSCNAHVFVPVVTDD